MDRQAFRARVFRAHCRWCPELARMTASCPWCEQEITDGFEAHEWLVKRSAVRVGWQDLIMVVENVVPVHGLCHERWGQTPEMATRCLEYVLRALDADKVGQWYIGLWQEHGLPVKRGMLIPPREIPMYRARAMLGQGLRVLGYSSIEE